MDAVEKLNTPDEALDYVERAEHGIVRTLHDIHAILKQIADRSDDKVIGLLAEGAMLKVESQLDY